MKFKVNKLFSLFRQFQLIKKTKLHENSIQDSRISFATNKQNRSQRQNFSVFQPDEVESFFVEGEAGDFLRLFRPSFLIVCAQAEVENGLEKLDLSPLRLVLVVRLVLQTFGNLEVKF